MDVEKMETNFDEYLPVFIYSHAKLPNKRVSCKTWDPVVTGELTDHHAKLTPYNLFTSVPENMIIVDPIPLGDTCRTARVVDDKFPELILRRGSNTFLKFYKYPYTRQTLKPFYQNAKLFYPNDHIYNLIMSFDTDASDLLKIGRHVPWNIRIPIMTEDGNVLTPVFESWTRKYGNAMDNCIFLSEMFKKLQKEQQTEGSELYDKKLIIYLISCRPSNMDDFKNPEYEQFFKDLERVQIQSQSNIEAFRPGTTISGIDPRTKRREDRGTDAHKRLYGDKGEGRMLFDHLLKTGKKGGSKRNHNKTKKKNKKKRYKKRKRTRKRRQRTHK